MEATAFMWIKTIELNFPFFQLPMVAVGEAGRHAG
jgi:hypothetical protein